MEKESHQPDIERAILRDPTIVGKSSGFGASNAGLDQPSGQLLWTQGGTSSEPPASGNTGSKAEE